MPLLFAAANFCLPLALAASNTAISSAQGGHSGAVGGRVRAPASRAATISFTRFLIASSYSEAAASAWLVGGRVHAPALKAARISVALLDNVLML